jgi:hypothetical protein
MKPLFPHRPLGSSAAIAFAAILVALLAHPLLRPVVRV